MSKQEWSITPEARDALMKRVAEARDADANARSIRAQVALEVLEAGAIGAGRVWTDQKDYAKALGISPAAVSGDLNLARVMQKTSLTPEHKDWGLLSRRAGNIGAVARSKKPTIAAAVKAARQAESRANTPAQAPAAQPPAPGDKGATGTTAAMQRVEEALQVLRDSCPTLTYQQWVTVRASLATITDEENKRSKGQHRAA